MREATTAQKRKQRTLPKLISVTGVLMIAAVMIGMVFRYASIASAYRAVNSTQKKIEESQRRITELEVQLDEAVSLDEARLAAAQAGDQARLAARRAGEDACVRRVRLSVETYVATRRRAALPADVPAELTARRAGVFTTLHKNGQLRGCIGTTEPTTDNVALVKTAVVPSRNSKPRNSAARSTGVTCAVRNWSRRPVWAIQ